MKTPMRELEEWIRSNVEHARKQRDEWPTQKDYYEGMLFAYSEMLNSIDLTYLDKEKEIIIDSYYEGAKGWVIEYYGDITDYDKEEAERYYNEKFSE